jgi:hypothetical protein
MLIASLAAVLPLGGCGGGERQDAKEAVRTYRLKLTDWSFKTTEAVARPVTIELDVENAGTETVPDIATTLDSLNYASKYPELAARQRPVWVIERGPGPVSKTNVNTQEVSIPGGAQTANVNTWALGPLAPGHVATFAWHVVPVKSGVHVLHFAITPSLGPKAKGALHAEFIAHIASAPPNTYVDPKTGKVVVGTYPPAN